MIYDYFSFFYLYEEIYYFNNKLEILFLIENLQR